MKIKARIERFDLPEDWASKGTSIHEIYAPCIKQKDGRILPIEPWVVAKERNKPPYMLFYVNEYAMLDRRMFITIKEGEEIEHNHAKSRILKWGHFKDKGKLYILIEIVNIPIIKNQTPIILPGKG